MMNLNKDILKLKAGESAIITADYKKLFSVISKILSILTKKQKKSGVYISISRPYEKFLSEIKGVDLDRILFLDGISGQLSKKPEYENCICLQGPTSLTEIGIYITQASNKSAIDFIILDSLSGIATYNDKKIVLRFLQYLVSKSKNLGAICIIFSDKSDKEKEIINALKDISDKFIEA